VAQQYRYEAEAAPICEYSVIFSELPDPSGQANVELWYFCSSACHRRGLGLCRGDGSRCVPGITLCPRAAGRGPRAWYSSVADMNFDTALYVCIMNSVSRTALYGLATLVLLFGIFVYPYSEYSYV
jgi:hypothetical protein